MYADDRDSDTKEDGLREIVLMRGLTFRFAIRVCTEVCRLIVQTFVFACSSLCISAAGCHDLACGDARSTINVEGRSTINVDGRSKINDNKSDYRR
jgi:hypothetical protein